MAKKNKDEILRLAASRFREAYDSDYDERLESDRDVRFAIDEGGCQWNETVRNIREGDNPPRPCLVINLIPEKIDQVEGEFRQAEMSYKVRAVDSAGDPKIADLMAGMLRFIEYDSQARDSYNTSFTSTLYGGRGGWRWNVVEDDGNPWVKCLKIDRITNVYTLYWDPFAKKMDKSDARYWFCTETIPKEEFKAKYGDKSLDEFGGNEMWELWTTEESMRVAEYWWKEEEEVTYYKVDRGGKVEIVTEVLFDDVVIDEKTGKKPKIKWCKLTAGRILEGPKDDWPSPYFPFVVQVGKEIFVKGQSRTRGMPRFAKEPQQLYNYAVSQITETFSLAPKAPFLVTARMIGNYKDIWDNMGVKTYQYLPYEADPVNPQLMPQRQEPPAVNPSMFNVLAVLEHNVMSAMGIFQAKLGDKGDEKSGKAIFARQAQGTTGAYAFSSNFAAALTHSCRIGISLIPHVYDTERIVRIVGEDGIEQDVPINAGQTGQMMQNYAARGPVPPQVPIVETPEGLINDLSAGKYDVRVTVGPSYSTQREEALAMLVEVVKTLPNIAPAVLDLIAENMDLPKSQELVRRLKKLVPVDIRGLEPGEQPPPPPPPDPKLMLEMEKLKLDLREVVRKEFDSYFKAIGVVAQAESLEAGRQMDEYMGVIDRHQKEQELAIQREQLAQQAQQAQQTPEG